MIHLRSINPMVRAIATMGAVAALVGGVTFANLTSNTVALSPNNLTTATASLAIGAGSTCPTGDTTSTTGLSDSSLAPGGSTSVNFCFDNTSGVPLLLTASIPQDLSASVAAQNTTLTVACTTEGTLAGTLSSWGPATFTTPIAAGTQDTCTATAALSTSYTGAGGETIPAFSIDFVGSQSS